MGNKIKDQQMELTEQQKDIIYESLESLYESLNSQPSSYWVVRGVDKVQHLTRIDELRELFELPA